jgi:hypothetical protein
VDNGIIRRDNYVFQRHENIILLIMVVSITLSGVFLAGLQLLAAYKLALLGKAEFASASELRENSSFKSSVVGLVILTISFAFFLVFVVDVYTLKDDSPSPQARTLMICSTSIRKYVPGASFTGRSDCADRPTSGTSDHLGAGAASSASDHRSARTITRAVMAKILEPRLARK